MNRRKGIVLAGGLGTRLHPITKFLSKQLIQVYDKPMIYYPISTLMLSGIREMVIISTPEHINMYKEIIYNIGNIGVEFSFLTQIEPKGIAESLILSEEYLNGAPCSLILGDNIFFGRGFSKLLQKANNEVEESTIFSYYVNNPNQYGVLSFDKENKIKSIIEKPSTFISNLAVTGLYFYDKHAPKLAKKLKPSKRGELEITDLNISYLKRNNLKVINLGRGFAWLDTGTPDGLLDSANFIATIEKRQGIKISCPEEIALRMSWLSDKEFKSLSNYNSQSDYGIYLRKTLEKKNAQ